MNDSAYIGGISKCICSVFPTRFGIYCVHKNDRKTFDIMGITMMKGLMLKEKIVFKFSTGFSFLENLSKFSEIHFLRKKVQETVFIRSKNV